MAAMGAVPSSDFLSCASFMPQGSCIARARCAALKPCARKRLRMRRKAVPRAPVRRRARHCPHCGRRTRRGHLLRTLHASALARPSASARRVAGVTACRPRRTHGQPPFARSPRLRPAPARRTLSAKPGAVPRTRVALSPEARHAMIAENAYLRAERRGFAPGQRGRRLARRRDRSRCAAEDQLRGLAPVAGGAAASSPGRGFGGRSPFE